MALRRFAQRRKCIAGERKSYVMYGNGIEYQRIVMAMNGQEWLWKRYEGRLFATDIPLKRL